MFFISLNLKYELFYLFVGDYKQKGAVWFLPFLSGILLGVSALPSKIWFISFLAFIPFLVSLQFIANKKRRNVYFLFQLLLMLSTFYLWVGFWVLQTANLGFIVGLFIVVPFLVLLFPYIFIFQKRPALANFFFVAAWLSAEYIQGYFELGSPFYNLGHNLGAAPKLIQWYEYTGAAGGTLWILVVNVVLYKLINGFINKSGEWKKQLVLVLSSILIPMLISMGIYYTYEEKGKSVEVLVLHPSTDNTDVKYRINIYDLLELYLENTLSHISDKTEYLVFPETAITNTGFIEDYHRNLVFNRWFERTAQFPNLKLISGAVAYEAIPNVGKIKNYRRIPGIRYSENYKTWYYTYNAALQLEQGQAVQFRVKDRLVPYQEYAPYPLILPRISPVGIDFQFSGKENNRQVFTASNGRKTAALICYETIYGNLFARAAREGAEAFFVLLNEGWYDDPKVPRQFLQLSVIRAIENRRSVVHSSNMGITAVISTKGEILSQTAIKEPDFIKQNVQFSRKWTLMAHLHNYIGILSLIFVFSIVLIAFFLLFLINKRR
jgi:apolipoprotein N-acyltransferase